MTAKKTTKAAEVKTEDSPAIDESLIESLRNENISLKESLEVSNGLIDELQGRLDEAEEQLKAFSTTEAEEPEPEPEKNKDGFVPGQQVSFADIAKTQRKAAEK